MSVDDPENRPGSDRQWWLTEGPEYCALCEAPVHPEVLTYCIACDRGVCSMCMNETLHIGRDLCLECITETEGGNG